MRVLVQILKNLLYQLNNWGMVLRIPGISFSRCAFRRRAHGSDAAEAAPTPDF